MKIKPSFDSCPPMLTLSGWSPNGLKWSGRKFICNTPTMPGASPRNSILPSTPPTKACASAGARMRGTALAALPVGQLGATGPCPGHVDSHDIPPGCRVGGRVQTTVLVGGNRTHAVIGEDARGRGRELDAFRFAASAVVVDDNADPATFRPPQTASGS